MTDIPQTVVNAADAVISQGVLGALLVLSIGGNVALVWALVRCYRFHQKGTSYD